MIINCNEYVINLGARAGLQAACNKHVKQAQVQSLLEVFNSYAYPESVKVLLLYVAYQAGRNNIDNLTASQVINDILDITRKCSENNEIMQELIRKYLGALKWVYTAITRGAHSVCYNKKDIVNKPIENIADTIAEKIAQAIGGQQRYGRSAGYRYR